ncbi:MAG: helicase-related protein, partial [Rikenellaceae bacterium]
VVVADIQQKLGFKKENVFTMSFARHNISYIVRECEDKRSMILKIIYSLNNGVGIIYCRTRKDCEELSAFLVSSGIKSDFYHGGLSYPMRSSKQESWIKEQIKVVVATNAFGMGIDKHNVRYVIHHDTPDTLEAYYQEAGRVGRDGHTSYAVMLSNKNDNASASRRIEGQYPSIAEIKQIYGLICNYLNIAIGDGDQAVNDFNIYDFCSKFRLFSTNVLNAVNILQLCGYMTLTENVDNPTRIHFSVSREELYRIQLTRSDLENFLSILLRSYTGLFTQFVPIDEHYLAHISGYTVQYINESFKKLGQLKVINYIPCRQTPLLIMNTERLSPDNIRIDANQYALRKEQSLKRLDSVFEYKDRIDKCRSLILQHYFGEQTDVECGTCDVCRAKLKRESQMMQDQNIETVKNVVIKILKEKPTDIKMLMKRVKSSQILIERGIKELLNDKIISQSIDGNLSIT